MKILVTGGAGFIGRNFLLYLRERRPEHELICVDKLCYGNEAEIRAAMKDMDVRLCVADIADREEVFSLFDELRPEAVVNLAAESHVDRSIENPALFFKTNALGTQALLDACLKYGISRFHQVSTDEVYGALPPDRPELLFTESSPLRPTNPYSASKAAADLLCEAYFKTYGLPVTISRCSNNYGPYQFADKLIPLIITKAWRNETIPIYGNGENIRDWLFVRDHCAALALILEGGASGEVYNIGGSCERKNISVARQILSILGRPEELIAFVADRRGHDLRYGMDAGYIKGSLGWSAKTEFDSGLSETVDWYVRRLRQPAL